MVPVENIHILIIEDNPGDARLIEEYLQESAVQFQPSINIERDIKSGINRLQEGYHDVILLDLSLPDSSGFETFEKVINVSGPVPIIVLTGLDDEKVGIEAVHRGAQDFLIKKEISPTILGRSILYAIQRSQLMQKLEKSQERLKQAQQLAHLGNFEHDLITGNLLWSEEIYRLLELKPDQAPFYFADFRKIIYPEDRGRVEEANKRVQRTGERQYIELRVRTQTGKTKYLYSILDPVKNNKGQVVKIFGTTHDITQRKKFEKRLKENERRYRMLFQATTDEILVFQLNDNKEPLPFLEVNDVACDILGYTHDELIQKTVYDIVDTDKQTINKQIKEVITQGKAVHETKHLTKEGLTIPLEISARSFNYDGRQTILSIGRDIRERRKLEREILNISEKERQRIGRDMHDDLGQMLTGIGLITRNLANKLRINDIQEADKLEEIVDMIQEADQHARSLARGLVPVNIQSNGLNSALQELITKAERMYDIDIHYYSTIDDVFDGDSSATHLYRIVQEAINNALKHGNATSIDVKLSYLGEYIQLCIVDNGQGFFESGEKDNGMGIRIMNFRAQMIGGNLEINSQEGKGTEVICKVPRTNRL